MIQERIIEPIMSNPMDVFLLALHILSGRKREQVIVLLLAEQGVYLPQATEGSISKFKL